MEQILAGYIYAVMLFLLLLTVLFIVYCFKRQSDGRKRYYRQIIDSASDIILVADRNKVVDANQHFFDFYSDFSTLSEFLKQHEDLSNTFEKEEGFLQKYMQGVYWLDYVLQNRKKVYKAKIMKNGQPHYFSVKAGMMEGLQKPLFNVLLQEITEQELYKNQLEHLSQTDALTGIGNRLYFNRSLNKEIQRSRRYKSDLSLLMFDIDFFKKVNDNYGHDVGDQVLVEISAVIQSLLRETDILCRFGGEEFAIIMPETGLIEAEKSAERLRSTIEKVSTSEFPSKLTISFGVGQVTKWDNEKTILKRVDNALYSAKELGRNRVVVAEGDVIQRP
jgi:diguanylate cyclase (GGDEF)-like protein